MRFLVVSKSSGRFSHTSPMVELSTVISVMSVHEEVMLMCDVG